MGLVLNMWRKTILRGITQIVEGPFYWSLLDAIASFPLKKRPSELHSRKTTLYVLLQLCTPVRQETVQLEPGSDGEEDWSSASISFFLSLSLVVRFIDLIYVLPPPGFNTSSTSSSPAGFFLVVSLQSHVTSQYSQGLKWKCLFNSTSRLAVAMNSCSQEIPSPFKPTLCISNPHIYCCCFFFSLSPPRFNHIEKNL